MIESTFDEFVRAPVGRFTIIGASSIVWCASPVLCGARFWATQTEADTRDVLRVFDRHLAPPADRHLADAFDIVLDTRGVDHVDAKCLTLLFSWLVSNRGALADHVRLQASVIREGPIAFLLTGLLPVVGKTHVYRCFTDPRPAFRALAGDGAEAVCEEVEALAERIRGVPKALLVLRELLAERVDITVEEVSRKLGTSPRSLQRLVSAHGTSFHQEVVAARFALAQKLLQTSDEKLASIAGSVGISERALTLLFKERTGLAPAEWRRAKRSGGPAR